MLLLRLRSSGYGFQQSRGFSQMGKAEKSCGKLQALDGWYRKGMHVSKDQIYRLLTRCANTKDLAYLRHLQALMICTGLDDVGTLADHAIRFFATNHRLLEADLAFCKVANPSVHTWHAIMSSHSLFGDCTRVFYLYQLMEQEYQQPNKFIFACILKACTNTYDLAQGKQVHQRILRQGVEVDVVLGSVLIELYAKCGELTIALEIFHRMSNKNTIMCNIMLAGLVEQKRLSSAFELFQEMLCQGLELSVVTFLCILKACINAGSVSEGKVIHDLCVKFGLEFDVSIGSALVDMYAKCKRIKEAQRIFEALPSKNIASWNALISGASQQGCEDLAIVHFVKMQTEGIVPDEVTLSSIASACGSIGAVELGQLVYDQLVRRGLFVDVIVGNTLVDMYGKCGRLKDAHKVFETLLIKNLVTWNTLMAAYSQHGFCDFAVRLFEDMHRHGMESNNSTLSCILSACGTLKDLGMGRALHDYAIKNGWSRDTLVGNSLVDMYAQCGSLEDASLVFKNLASRSVVSWNAIVHGQLLHERNHCAWDLFAKMLEDEVEPNEVSLLSLLKCVGALGDLSKGMLLQVWILNNELQMDVAVGNMLMDMYVKCRAVEEAHNIFDSMKYRDVVSWGIMIRGYAQHEHSSIVALQLCCDMQKQGMQLNPILLSCALNACVSVRDLRFGRLIHEEILARKLELNTCLGNNLVDMYAKCEALEDASAVFRRLSGRDLVTWNAMITGYAQKGFTECALDVFKDLLLENLLPNEVTFSCILNVCACKEYLEQGRLIHSQVYESGYQQDTVISNTLVNMYCKSGVLEDAHSILDQSISKDVVAWNSMLAGYVDQGCASLAIKLFEKMQEKDVRPDKLTFAGLLKACSSIGLLEQGNRVHEELVGSGIAVDSVIGNSLVDMYIKCGSLETAMGVFANLHGHNTVTFNTIISGCVQHELGFSALQCFEEMQRDGVQPNEVTFLSTIKASGSIGAVKHGRWMHDQVLRHGLESNQEIGNSLISMYFMFGSLEEATKSFVTLSNQNVVSWSALISGYSAHGNFLQARQCLEHMQQQGFKPLDMVFTSILSACSHEGKVQEGHGVFETMKEHYGIRPSLEHYNCMLQLLGSAGHLKEAEHVLKTMPIAADFCSWMTLLLSCRSFGEVQLGRTYNDFIVANQSVESIMPNKDSDFLLMRSQGST